MIRPESELIVPEMVFIYHDQDEQPIKTRPILGGMLYHGDDNWEKATAFVGTNLVEFVTVWYAGGRGKMFVDDLGHQKELPLNTFATGIYWAAQLRRRFVSGEHTLEAHPILGRAVLFPPGSID
jgi:hypothetical protein